MLVDVHGTNQLTSVIIGCAVDVHRVIGPGVYESVYRECMQYELAERKLQFEVERCAPVIYKGVTLRSQFYIDLVVEGVVAVELKAVTALAEIHERQILTQLRLASLPVGLLFNFNVATLVNGGLRRLVNPATQRR